MTTTVIPAANIGLPWHEARCDICDGALVYTGQDRFTVVEAALEHDEGHEIADSFSGPEFTDPIGDTFTEMGGQP